MLGKAINEGQGMLQLGEPMTVTQKIYRAAGLVRLEDLDRPHFDPERELTMEQYLGEIGARMAEQPRESGTKDSPLELHRNDFQSASSGVLEKGLFLPFKKGRLVRKPFVTVSEWYHDLDPATISRPVDFRTGVAVPEELYQDLVQHAPSFADRIANRTEKANKDDYKLDVEEVGDLGGESVFYALAQKHIGDSTQDDPNGWDGLEDWQRELGEQRRILSAFRKSLAEPQPKRIINLEKYRIDALEILQDMARVACKGLGAQDPAYEYGTTKVEKTLVSVASNIHRSPQRAQHIEALTELGIGHLDAMRIRVNQSIHGIFGEMINWRESLINNIDRDYED